LSWFSAFIPFNAALYATAPLIPLFTAMLGGSPIEVGLIVAANQIAAVPALLIWGRALDRSGKRKIFVVFSFASSAAIYALLWLTSSIQLLALSYTLLAVFSTASIPAPTMLIIETYRKLEWEDRIARFNFSVGLGWISGLILGSTWLNFYDIKSFFALCAVLSSLSALLSHALIEDPKITLESKPFILHFVHASSEIAKSFFTFATEIPQIVHLRRLVRQARTALTRDLPLFFSSAFTFFIGSALTFTQFPLFVGERYKMAASQVLVLYLSMAVVAEVFYRIAAQLATGSHASLLLARATYLRAAMATGFAIIAMLVIPMQTLPFLVILFVIAGFSWSIISVTSQVVVSKLAQAGKRGQTLAIYNMLGSSATILGAVLSGIIVKYAGYTSMFLLAATFYFMSSIQVHRIKL
jgi:MFS family permease